MEYFNNVHDALLFAHRFGSEQFAMSPLAKMMKNKGGNLGTGKGLQALDGAGMAGMIQAHVERLLPLHKACILARFAERADQCPCCDGWRMTAEYKGALQVLAEWARPLVREEVDSQRMRFGIVQAFYDRKATITQLAKSIGMPPRTVLDQKNKIWAELGPIDKLALANIEASLERMCGDLAD